MDIRHLKSNSESVPGNGARNGFDDDLRFNREDSALFEKIGYYMKGRFDLEEVLNDPSLPEVDKVVKEMISDYHPKGTGHTDDVKFIRGIIAGDDLEKKLLDEINNIKIEIRNNNINEISEEWVKEFHEKRRLSNSTDPKKDEIRDFIKKSLRTDINEPEISINQKNGRAFTKSLLVRYISLSAAAVIGIFILLRTLLPYSDPVKLFNSYYEPFSAISYVTRGNTTDDQESFYAGVTSYKIGDYESATKGFSNAILKDSSFIASRFFMGLTQLALKNYNQAINMFNGISGRSGEFSKETEWYLGLAYLRTGEKEKAVKYFELLAQSPGFYMDRSVKILHRLK